MADARYAHDTDVPVAKSRSEIDHLLKRWGCDAIQWTDEFRAGQAILRFRWRNGVTDYNARLTVRIPPDDVLRRGFKRPPTADQLQRARDQRWRALHRVLLLTIKAQLNAVDAGLVTAVDVFLPHLEAADGRTVAEIMTPQLRALTDGQAVHRG